MLQGGTNVDVQTTDQGAAEIKKQADSCLETIRDEYGCEGITEEMVRYCLENADPILSDFAGANRKGATEKTVVVEKCVKDGDEWTRECQIAVEIDADEANAGMDHSGHLGCEIYFANKNKCAGKTMKDPRIGRRVFKMHASLPDGQNPPHYRHEPGSEGSVVVYPASEQTNPGSDLKVLYRCRIKTKGHVQ